MLVHGQLLELPFIYFSNPITFPNKVWTNLTPNEPKANTWSWVKNFTITACNFYANLEQNTTTVPISPPDAQIRASLFII